MRYDSSRTSNRAHHEHRHRRRRTGRPVLRLSHEARTTASHRVRVVERDAGRCHLRLGRRVLRRRARVRARDRPRAVRVDDAQPGGARFDVHRASGRAGAAREQHVPPDGAHRPAESAAGALSRGRRGRRVRPPRRRYRRVRRLRSRRRGRRREQRDPHALRERVRADDRRAAEQARLVRHDPPVRSAVAHLPRRTRTA